MGPCFSLSHFPLGNNGRIQHLGVILGITLSLPLHSQSITKRLQYKNKNSLHLLGTYYVSGTVEVLYMCSLVQHSQSTFHVHHIQPSPRYLHSCLNNYKNVLFFKILHAEVELLISHFMTHCHHWALHGLSPIFCVYGLFSPLLPPSPMVCGSVFGKHVLFSVHVFLIYLNGTVL